jgi:hypothetical protein
MHCLLRWAAWGFLFASVGSAPVTTGFAEELLRSESAHVAAGKITAHKPVLAPAAELPLAHPIAAVIRFAEQEKQYLERKVHSVRCQVIKRERIDGELQEHQFLVMELEEQIRKDNAIERPMRVFLSFQAPAEVNGRKVLFVEGSNSGKMLVRKGGRRFSYAVLRIEPDGESARRESLLPITELGFGRLLDRQIAVLRSHAAIDPKGENTEVRHIKDAKINGRSCEVVRVRHPVRQPGLTFHQANVFIDAELHIPVRIDASDWPTAPGDECPLLAEYTYTNVQLNVNFPEATFDETRLKK